MNRTAFSLPEHSEYRTSGGLAISRAVEQFTGNVDPKRYEDVAPIYSEYNVGNFVRSFTLSTKIASDEISASVADGVLTVRLPKAKEALARRIEIR